MSRIVSRAESWERAYTAFQNVNFAAFDYNVIKQSMIDYVKLYFPEDFNDYIESSEFIAMLELFAYIGELLMYRVDMNSLENFIDTAQRKQSVLRLAKLISYNPSRNMPARGLVKIQWNWFQRHSMNSVHMKNAQNQIQDSLYFMDQTVLVMHLIQLDSLCFPNKETFNCYQLRLMVSRRTKCLILKQTI